MSLNEIFEIAGYATMGIVGLSAFGLAFNEACKQGVNWAEKNKFYDKGVKFSDLENKSSSDFNQELTNMQYKKYAESVN